MKTLKIGDQESFSSKVNKEKKKRLSLFSKQKFAKNLVKSLSESDYSEARISADKSRVDFLEDYQRQNHLNLSYSNYSGMSKHIE